MRVSKLGATGAAPERTRRLLVLLCGPPVPAVLAKYGNYHDLYGNLFIKVLASDPSRLADWALEITSFNSVAEEYPDDELVRSSDGLLIAGSGSSAYEKIPWIDRLTSYVAGLPELAPRLRLIGICFGHQIVARAFGSTVELNPAGWEIGVREVELTEVGRALLAKGPAATIRIHQLHRDHVRQLPKNFTNLGSTHKCPVHGMVRFLSVDGNDAGRSGLADISILTLQGHPEFNTDIVSKIIDLREDIGILSHELAEESRAYAREDHEGVWFGRLCVSVLGMPPPEDMPTAKVL